MLQYRFKISKTKSFYFRNCNMNDQISIVNFHQEGSTSASYSSENNDAASVQIRIGIIGHRKLSDSRMIINRFDIILDELDRILDRTKYSLIAISALAEGADRIGAREVLRREVPSALEVVLPFPSLEYMNDFQESDSQDEFLSLMKCANKVTIVENTSSKEDAYQKASYQIVKSCDILVAVWNGLPAVGKGGTAETVDFARFLGKTIFWIHADTGKIIREKCQDDLSKSLEKLNKFNKERINDSAIAEKYNDQYKRVHANAVNSGLVTKLQTEINSVLQTFIRADLLANRYQNLHLMAGTVVYILSACAVITSAIQLFFSDYFSILIWVEMCELVIILALIIIAKSFDWHTKWLDYRSLAEHLRTFLFFSFVGIDLENEINKPFFEDWVYRLFNTIVHTFLNKDQNAPQSMSSKRLFMLQSWINPEVIYYRNIGRRLRRYYHVLSGLTLILFCLTILSLLILAGGAIQTNFFTNILLFLSATLPALGAAASAIQTHQDLQRTSDQANRMVRLLSAIGVEIEQVKNDRELENLFRSAAKAILSENQGWKEASYYRPVEPQ
jgi:hypothetical protein